MSKRFLQILLLSFARFLASPFVALGVEETYQVEVHKDIRIPMRDGLRLSANIFLPKAEGKYPVILMRSPYKTSAK
jgi:predicted acyl esterase